VSRIYEKKRNSKTVNMDFISLLSLDNSRQLNESEDLFIFSENSECELVPIEDLVLSVEEENSTLNGNIEKSNNNINGINNNTIGNEPWSSIHTTLKTPLSESDVSPSKRQLAHKVFKGPQKPNLSSVNSKNLTEPPAEFKLKPVPGTGKERLPRHLLKQLSIDQNLVNELEQKYLSLDHSIDSDSDSLPSYSKVVSFSEKNDEINLNSPLPRYSTSVSTIPETNEPILKPLSMNSNSLNPVIKKSSPSSSSSSSSTTTITTTTSYAAGTEKKVTIVVNENQNQNHVNVGHDSLQVKTYEPSNRRVTCKRRKICMSCTKCRESHTSCDGARPCSRCIKRGYPEQCLDALKKRSDLNQRACPGCPAILLPKIPIPPIPNNNATISTNRISTTSNNNNRNNSLKPPQDINDTMMASPIPSYGPPPIPMPTPMSTSCDILSILPFQPNNVIQSTHNTNNVSDNINDIFPLFGNINFTDSIYQEPLIDGNTRPFDLSAMFIKTNNNNNSINTNNININSNNNNYTDSVPPTPYHTCGFLPQSQFTSPMAYEIYSSLSLIAHPPLPFVNKISSSSSSSPSSSSTSTSSSLELSLNGVLHCPGCPLSGLSPYKNLRGEWLTLYNWIENILDQSHQERARRAIGKLAAQIATTPNLHTMSGTFIVTNRYSTCNSSTPNNSTPSIQSSSPSTPITTTSISTGISTTPSTLSTPSSNSSSNSNSTLILVDVSISLLVIRSLDSRFMVGEGIYEAFNDISQSLQIWECWAEGGGNGKGKLRKNGEWIEWTLIRK